MADDRGRDLPDLEMPSLFGRRRKRGRAAEESPAEATPQAAPAPAPEAAAEPAQPPVRRRPPTPPPSSRPTGPAAPAGRGAEPATETTTELPVAPRPAATTTTPAPTPAPAPVPAPASTDGTEDTQPIAARTTGAPARPPRPTAPPPPRRGPEMTWSNPTPTPTPAAAPALAPAPAPEAEEPAGPSRPRRRVALPDLAAVGAAARRVPRPTRGSVASLGLRGRVAAAVTGGVVVVVGVALFWATLQACTAVRGVASCGGVGLLAILAVLGLQVLVGAVLLAAWRVAEPRGTSMIGVGLVSTIAMVLLYASTPTPLLSALLVLVGPAAYVVAQGITASSFQLRD